RLWCRSGTILFFGAIVRHGLVCDASYRSHGEIIFPCLWNSNRSQPVCVSALCVSHSCLPHEPLPVHDPASGVIAIELAPAMPVTTVHAIQLVPTPRLLFETTPFQPGSRPCRFSITAVFPTPNCGPFPFMS